MTPDEVAALRADMKKMTESFGELKTSVALLNQESQHTERSCPYRVQVARNTNGLREARDDAKEALVLAQNNRVTIAKYIGSGLLGGSVVAVAQVVMALAK